MYEPRSFVTGGCQDNVGFCFTTALGVKIANPDKPVVSISGDGGFMFGVQELATAVKYSINLVTVVFNNSSYGNVLRDQRNVYKGREIGSTLTNPDFVKLAESFGATAYRAKTPAELKAALEKGFAQSGPALIEVPTERGSEVSPWPCLNPNLWNAVVSRDCRIPATEEWLALTRRKITLTSASASDELTLSRPVPAAGVARQRSFAANSEKVESAARHARSIFSF